MMATDKRESGVRAHLKVIRLASKREADPAVRPSYVCVPLIFVKVVTSPMGRLKIKFDSVINLQYLS